jgi:hypothetical protein
LPLLAGTVSAVAANPRATPPLGTQLAELKGSDTARGNFFGMAVAISGTTAIVGAPWFAGTVGRAYVFTETGNHWKQVAELTGSDTKIYDFFGSSVAISGGTALVGAPGGIGSVSGRVYVFTNTATGWTQVAELKGYNRGRDNFGGSVAISGTTAVVSGSVGASGRAYIFTKTASGWEQTAKLNADQESYGPPVAISGTTVLLGSEATETGRAYVFTKVGAAWKQVAELRGSDVVTGDDFGASVAISGTTAVVGAPGFQRYLGHAYVFAESGGRWRQTAELTGSDTAIVDDFGLPVAISGTTVVVGAPIHATVAGRAYVFTRTAAGWVQVAELKGSDTRAGDTFGSASISGKTAVVGAYNHAYHAGRAYVFEV